MEQHTRKTLGNADLNDIQIRDVSGEWRACTLADLLETLQKTHVIDPTGGITVDAEARTAIIAILVTLETYKMHATS